MALARLPEVHCILILRLRPPETSVRLRRLAMRPKLIRPGSLETRFVLSFGGAWPDSPCHPSIRIPGGPPGHGRGSYPMDRCALARRCSLNFRSAGGSRGTNATGPSPSFRRCPLLVEPDNRPRAGLSRRGGKGPGRSHLIVCHAPLRNPIRRVDPGNGPGSPMNEVVADGAYSVVERYMPVKVMEDEEAGKKEPGTPEWGGNPSI